jgi:hypothetical protein
LTYQLNVLTNKFDKERLTKPSGQGASPKTVRMYGEAMQRSHGGFVGRAEADNSKSDY